MRQIHAVLHSDDEVVLLGLWLLAEKMMNEFGQRFGSDISLFVRGEETSWGSSSNHLVKEGGASKPPAIPNEMRAKCDALCKGLWKCAKVHFHEHELDLLKFHAHGLIEVKFCFKVGSGGIPEKYLVFRK